MGKPTIEVVSYKLVSADESEVTVHCFGVNAGRRVVSALSLWPVPAPDTRIIQRAAAWIAPAGAPQSYYVEPGYALAWVALTGHPGMDCIMPLASDITGRECSYVTLEGPLVTPYGIGLLVNPCTLVSAGDELKVRILYA